MDKCENSRSQASFSRTQDKARVVLPEPERQVLAKATQSPLPHLPFPPEIRDRIYTHILYSSSNIRLVDGMNRFYMNGRPADRYLLSALLLSRGTYIEAFHIFYKINTFVFTSTDVLYQFLRNIGYPRRQQVTDIEFNWSGLDPKRAFRLLKTCQGLKSLKINMNGEALQGFAALREVRGLENVTVSRETNALTQHGGFQALEQAMMRPRLKSHTVNPDRKINLFNGKREVFKMIEDRRLTTENRSIKALVCATRTWD